MKPLRLAGINAAVLLALMVGLNLLSAVILAIAPPAKRENETAGPGKAELPNYRRERQRAQAIFADLERWDERFVPFLDWAVKPYRGPTTTVNKQGDRVTPRPPRSRAKATKVIRFFGGSTMWGVGSDDARTIPAIFARFNPTDLVLNHGQMAHNSRQNLERLINLLNQGARVGTVVFYEGYNDVLSLCRKDTSVNGHLAEAKMRAKLDRSDEGSSRSPSLGAAVRTVLIGRTEDLVRKLAGKPAESAGDEGPAGPVHADCAESPAEARHVARTVLENMEIARQLTVAAGGRFIAIIHPVAFVGRPRIDHLRGQNFGQMRKRLRAVYPVWRRAARRLPWLYDFTDAFDRHEYIYIDAVHVSPNGNEILARRISRILAEN